MFIRLRSMAQIDIYVNLHIRIRAVLPSLLVWLDFVYGPSTHFRLFRARSVT